METMGDRISRQRRLLNLHQKDIARKLGVVRQTVSLWENNHTKDLHARNLRALADILKVSPDWILTGDAAPNRSETNKATPADDDLCGRIRHMTDAERQQVARYLDQLESEQRELYEQLRQRFEK
jgi:transcriptional regulator with XRE-family HTH domain